VKFEYRNPKQAQMTEIQNSEPTLRLVLMFRSFLFLCFGFVSDFVLRISDFEFHLAVGGTDKLVCPCVLRGSRIRHHRTLKRV